MELIESNSALNYEVLFGGREAGGYRATRGDVSITLRLETEDPMGCGSEAMEMAKMIII